MLSLATTIAPRNCPIVQFPARGPFAVQVQRDQDGWLVVCRDHGWLHGSHHEAAADATEIARGFGVAIVEAQS